MLTRMLWRAPAGLELNLRLTLGEAREVIRARWILWRASLLIRAAERLLEREDSRRDLRR